MLGKKSSLAPVLACLRDNGVGLCNIFRITHACITSVVFFLCCDNNHKYGNGNDNDNYMTTMTMMIIMSMRMTVINAFIVSIINVN